jgi:hypothetical protein
LFEPEEPKDLLPAAITSAEVAADQRAPNIVRALIAELGEEAIWRYVEFFTANIRVWSAAHPGAARSRSK